MSANAWGTCPRCKQKNQAVLEKSYGKQSLSEFLDILDETSPLIDDGLREDWEIWRDGFILNIRYRCACEECGFVYEIKDKRNME